MKRVFFILLLAKTLIYPTQEIGLDSGLKSIILYSNKSDNDRAVVMIGGIHGDEIETVDIVNYLQNNLESELALYFIPSLNPTLSNIEVEDGKYKILEGRRGYLAESLDKNGFVIPGKDLSKFNKDLYYRIFYGTNTTFNQGIKHYIDPNRDFHSERLPSTRAFKEFIDELLKSHREVVILSIHAYMSGGRIYPEYKLVKDRIVIDNRVKELALEFSEASGYLYRDFYEPAIPIKGRFIGELIEYYGSIEEVVAFDIELDKIDRGKNKRRILKGVEALLLYLNKK